MSKGSTEEYWYGQVRKGLLEYIVLRVLEKEQNYGYAILQEVRSLKSMSTVTESAVYPILARLVKEGMISSQSIKTESAGPPRKYFELQAKGRIRLAFMERYVRDLAADIINFHDKKK